MFCLYRRLCLSLTGILLAGLLCPGIGISEEEQEPSFSSVQQVFSQRNKKDEASLSPETPPQKQQSEQQQDRQKAAQSASEKKSVGQNGKIRLFGTLELLTKVGDMPKWNAVLDKERKNPGFVDDRTFRSAETWKTMRGRIEGLSTLEQLREVNKLLNRWPYRTDMEVWGVEDYWAAPVDFSRNLVTAKILPLLSILRSAIWGFRSQPCVLSLFKTRCVMWPTPFASCMRMVRRGSSTVSAMLFCRTRGLCITSLSSH